ncbi:MAG: hypothetical protein KDC98_16145 [Planctomycetes bacterium]|nr:hypothetical protein [Planctomycetota bacterium]
MRTWTKRCVCGGLAVALAGCQGDGSDIGPRFEPVPSSSSKVNVYDDDNHGVVGATVAVSGSGDRALTGRNGRGDLFASMSGRPVIGVQAAQASAVAGDMLGSLTAAMPMTGGDLPMVLHLPDVANSSSFPFTVGLQSGPTAVTNALTAGGVLSAAPGTTIAMTNGAGQGTLRTASLRAVHLAGELPGGNAILFGRGVYIDPPQVTFTPGATLEVVDDVLMTATNTAGTVTLYRLDDTTGEWSAVGNAVASAGTIRSVGGIDRGGLHAFGLLVTGGSVRGRVVDARGDAVRDALVCVDGRWTRTGGDGRFLVDDVPAVTGDGAPRGAEIEVFAGGDWLPAIATASVVMNGTDEIVIADVVLDTARCTNIRIQQVRRARAEPIRPARISSLFDAVALAAMSDADGRVVYEDVPSRWFGFQEAFAKDRERAYYAQAVGYSNPGQRWLDAFQFFDELPWMVGSRSSRVLVTDAVGGGPIYDAAVVQGADPDQGHVGQTREAGVLFAGRSLNGRVTGSFRSERDGEVIVHAFSIVHPDGEHIELPIRQVLRRPLGAFDRFGMVAGTVTGADAGAVHRLRVTRRIERQEWWDQAVTGTAIRSALPIELDPAATHGAFVAGVDRSGGHLAVAELDGTASTLQKLAVAEDVVPVEGGVTVMDLALEHEASAVFSAPGVLAALDGAIPSGALGFDLALEQPSGRVVDIVQGLTGNHTVSGADVTFSLPALGGAIADDAWLVMLGGSATGGGGTVSQHCMLRLAGGATTTTAAMLAAPTITSPSPGETVASGGFTVRFALPAAAQYAALELRSQVTGELLLWDILIPPGTAEFAFVRLPAAADSPLIPGRDYILTLSAFAAFADGPLSVSNYPYRELTTFLQSIGATERGVYAVSSHRIEIRTQ